MVEEGGDVEVEIGVLGLEDEGLHRCGIFRLYEGRAGLEVERVGFYQVERLPVPGVGRHIFGMEKGDAVDAPEEQGAVLVLVVGIQIELVVGQPVAFVKGLDEPARFLEAHEALVAGQPQVAVRIGINRMDIVVRHALLGVVLLDPPGLGIPVEEAGPAGSDPKAAVGIFIEVLDTHVARLRPGFHGLSPDAVLRIEQEEAIRGTHPEPFAVFVEQVGFLA